MCFLRLIAVEAGEHFDVTKRTSYLLSGKPPSPVSYQMNEEIFLLVTLPGSKKALPVPGIVVWQSPSSASDGRKPGVGIEFKGREGNSLRNTIEGILGARVSGPEPTYTM